MCPSSGLCRHWGTPSGRILRDVLALLCNGVLMVCVCPPAGLRPMCGGAATFGVQQRLALPCCLSFVSVRCVRRCPRCLTIFALLIADTVLGCPIPCPVCPMSCYNCLRYIVSRLRYIASRAYGVGGGTATCDFVCSKAGAESANFLGFRGALAPESVQPICRGSSSWHVAFHCPRRIEVGSSAPRPLAEQHRGHRHHRR